MINEATTSKLPIDNEKKPLPNGWKWVRLGDICNFVGGMQPPAFMFKRQPLPGYVRLVQIQDFRKNDLAVYIPIEEAKRTFKDDDVMIGRYGPPVFQILRGLSGAYNVALIKTVPNEDLLLKDFLYYLLKEKTIQKAVIAQSERSAGQSGVQKEFLEKFIIPLPPLHEQKRIAAILAEQLAAVDQARKAAQEQLEAAKGLPAAYLREVFESEEANGWERKKLGEFGEIASGITLGNRLHKQKTQMIPYLRVANVKDGYLDLSNVYNIEATNTEIEKLQLRYGDILLTEGGDPDKLGRGTFWEEQISNCIHQNHIFRVRFDLKRFSPQFISLQIGSSYGKEYFLAHAKQTTGIATINQKVLSNFPLMTPPFIEQKRIVERLKEQIVISEQTQKLLQDQLNTINKLPSALLQRAFSGEL